MASELRIGFVQATNDIDMQVFRPLAFGYLNAYLERYLDIPVSMTYLDSLAGLESYDLIAVSSTSQDYARAIEIAREAKRRNPGAPTVLGGHHVTYLPHTLVRELDYGVIGEGEETFLELVRYISDYGLESHPGLLRKIKGIAFHTDDGIEVTPARDLIHPLDRIPYPFRSAEKSPYLFTSRGCPYGCAFCASSAFWRKTRFFSPEYVVGEIESILAQFPSTRHIPIQDDLIVADIPRFKAIVELLEKRGLTGKVSFALNVRAGLVDDELCELLKRIGAAAVYFGAESASDRVLGLMVKRTTVAQSQRALDILHKHGLTAACSFIVGWPSETEEEVRQTYEFIIRNVKKDALSATSPVNILMPMPGTQVWERAVERGFVDVKAFDWKRLAVFASYRQSNVGAFADWLEHRRANDAIYLNEETLPQERLYEIMAEYEERIRALESGIAMGWTAAPSSRLADLSLVSPLQLSKEERLYYHNQRPEFLALMDAPPECVLEIGCAAGNLGRAVKRQFPDCRYLGVELVPEVAAQARQVLDLVIEGDVEKVDLARLGLECESLDYVICGDVLEHLYDPWTLLWRLRPYLKKNGRLLASIPNVRHVSILRALMGGRFPYESRGILDATHIRFFTLAEMREMLLSAGYQMDQLHKARDIIIPDSKWPINLDLGKFVIKNVTREEADDLGTVQYVFSASLDAAFVAPEEGKDAGAPRAKCSVVLSLAGDLESIQRCIYALAENTPEDLYEAIIVDNEPTPETQEFLGCLEGNVTVIHNDQPHGRAEVRNQGAKAASGKYLVFLDSDTVPQPGWLEAMLSTAEADERVGVVGSLLLNPDGSIRHVGIVVGDDRALKLFLGSEDLKTHVDYLSQVRDYQMIGGACVLVRSSLFGALGGFDEGYSDEYGDLDLCLRAGEQGYRVVYAPGSALMQNGPALRSDARESEGRARFYARWGERLQPDLARYEALTRNDLVPHSIVIVTYNSSRTIGACLRSVFRYTPEAHEIIVVDNASSDETLPLVRSLVKDYPNLRIIANSRNAGFSRATNQGILASCGKNVVLLNPDTAVTPGWLSRMSGYLADGVGAVGPVSNHASGLQVLTAHVKLGDEAPSVDEIVQMLHRERLGKAVETRLLTGFCMLISRSALDKVGLLDESLFLGNDDLDLSWRLRLCGYRLLVATDVFVYHEGQASFATEPSEVTRRLVQKSTDALASKLERHYGEGQVPTSDELWGVSWFSPTRKSIFRQPAGIPESPLLDNGVSSHVNASIVILTYNQLEYTSLCLDSIRRHTAEPYEIIVVDNGSTDGTVDFLRAQADVRLVANAQNLGFAQGCNQGIALARGEYVVLLNNDTVVTEGWLTRMIAAAEKPGVGIVGPRSNYVVGPQLIPNVPYKDLDGMHGFAAQLGAALEGQVAETYRVIGFCMLVRREVIEKIGGLDARFGTGNFEDDDYCIRAVIAGYRILIAMDAFVHHFGGRTFQGAKIDYSEAIRGNWSRFRAKWDIPSKHRLEDQSYPIATLVKQRFNRKKHYCRLPTRSRSESIEEPAILSQPTAYPNASGER